MPKMRKNYRLVLVNTDLSVVQIAHLLGKHRNLSQMSLSERLNDAHLLKDGYELKLSWAHDFSDFSIFEFNGFNVIFDEEEDTNPFVKHRNEYANYKGRLKALVESLDETNEALPVLKETLEKLDNNFFGSYQGGYAG